MFGTTRLPVIGQRRDRKKFLWWPKTFMVDRVRYRVWLSWVTYKEVYRGYACHSCFLKVGVVAGKINKRGAGCVECDYKWELEKVVIPGTAPKAKAKYNKDLDKE